MAKVYWEHFHHQADVGVRGIGATPAQAFEQAALALTAVLTAPERIQGRSPVEIRLEAPDLEFLLFRWLNELVYQMATRRMLFGRFDVDIDHSRLRATAWGEPLVRDVHRPAVEVKGATLTALAVHQDKDGAWRAQCVVDV
jgi:SHS2 domain-containing protein